MRKKLLIKLNLNLCILLVIPLVFGCRNAEEGDTELTDDEPLTQDADPTVEQAEPSTMDSEARIVINEFMPSNATIIRDEAGGSGDWIELYNLSDSSIDLVGYFISDKPDNPTKFELGAGLVIEAGGTLLLWADSDVEQGPNHLSFNLSKAGEAIVFTSPTGDLLDSIDYENATTDSSFARSPDGIGAFGFCHSPTPDAPNDSACAL